MSNVLSGFQWLLEHHKEYKIRVVNISVGAVSDRRNNETSPLYTMIGKLWDAGLVVIAAAGNEGPKKGSITSPGIHPKIITVGCSDVFRSVNNRKEEIIHYSGQGPVPANCVVKPEVIAPGANILSCSNQIYNPKMMYVTKSGTSMSTPIVVGAMALLCEACPRLTNGQMKLCLKESCKDLGYAKSRQGWGLLQIEQLIRVGKRKEGFS
jgi:serine protease AprX